MVAVVKRLRDWLRRYFTYSVFEDEPLPCVQDTTRSKPKTHRRHSRSVPPSERFVWAMALLLVALVGLIALEAIYIVITKQISNELIAGISAVMASLATAFLMGRKQ